MKPSDDEPVELRKLIFSAQLPEAGKFRVLPLNRKFFATRNLTATFAPNGKLASWGYKSSSRAEASSAFAKEQAALLNTIATEAVTRRNNDETKEATTRANSAKLETQIVAKENELKLAQATVPVRVTSYDRAIEERNAARDDPAKANTLNALHSAVDMAALAVLTAKNSVITAQAELDALRAKRADVRAGLLTP